MTDSQVLRQCAARMIVEGSWDDLSDKAINKAFAEPSSSSWMKSAAFEHRDSGALRQEIHAQLYALPEVQRIK